MKSKSYRNGMIVIISLFVMSCSSTESKTKTAQAEPLSVTETTDKGKLLFEVKCAACHGSDGTAGIANAANLQTSKLDSISISRIIKNGKNAFKGQLNGEEIEKVVGYFHVLRKSKRH
jgi:mono/diheme cytochrome c family protein